MASGKNVHLYRIQLSRNQDQSNSTTHSTNNETTTSTSNYSLSVSYIASLHLRGWSPIHSLFLFHSADTTTNTTTPIPTTTTKKNTTTTSGLRLLVASALKLGIWDIPTLEKDSKNESENGKEMKLDEDSLEVKQFAFRRVVRSICLIVLLYTSR